MFVVFCVYVHLFSCIYNIVSQSIAVKYTSNLIGGNKNWTHIEFQRNVAVNTYSVLAAGLVQFISSFVFLFFCMCKWILKAILGTFLNNVDTTTTKDRSSLFFRFDFSILSIFWFVAKQKWKIPWIRFIESGDSQTNVEKYKTEV